MKVGFDSRKMIAFRKFFTQVHVGGNSEKREKALVTGVLSYALYKWPSLILKIIALNLVQWTVGSKNNNLIPRVQTKPSAYLNITYFPDH